MSKRISKLQGFTLIELMIVVAILGILASVAVPSFVMMLRRSRTAEATTNLNAMFKSASAYYNGELSGQKLGATTSGYCTVDDGDKSPASPTDFKQKFTADIDFTSLGFHVADFVFYAYSMDSAAAKCGNLESQDTIYTFRASGDLDGDTTESNFELAAGSDSKNVLYHSRGIYIANETE